MKSTKIYIIFLIIGLFLLLISLFGIEKPIFNIHNIYIVVESKVLALFIFILYTLSAAIYFFIQKHSNRMIGILHLMFITIAVLHFMFSYLISDNIPPINYITHPVLLNLKYLPALMMSLFLLGQLLLILNIIIALVKYSNRTASA
jgi:hypothetical protein